jgi:hypothetical protein
MIGGVAFTLLKVGRARPKSAKQVETRLAILPKILGFAARRQNPHAGADEKHGNIARLAVNFRRIWLIRLEWLDLLSRTQFLPCNWRSVLPGAAGKRSYKYSYGVFYLEILLVDRDIAPQAPICFDGNVEYLGAEGFDRAAIAGRAPEYGYPIEEMVSQRTLR